MPELETGSKPGGLLICQICFVQMPWESIEDEQINLLTPS